MEQRAKARNVAARVDVQTAQLRLLRAHLGRCTEERLGRGKEGRVGEPSLGGFGDAEVNHLGDRHPVVERDQDVREVRVIREGLGLAFGGRTRNDLPGIRAQLDHLQRDVAAQGFLLLGQ